MRLFFALDNSGEAPTGSVENIHNKQFVSYWLCAACRTDLFQSCVYSVIHRQAFKGAGKHLKGYAVDSLGIESSN